LLLLNLAEPISATIIYPFIAQVLSSPQANLPCAEKSQLVDELGMARDKSSIGYYVGVVVCTMLFPFFHHS